MKTRDVFSQIGLNKNYLEHKKFLYAIVDQDSIRTVHPRLFKKMYDITYSFTHRMSNSAVSGDVRNFDNIDQCMAASDDYDIILIQNIGNFIRINKFFELLNNYCESNPDFFIVAFTLDWQAEKNADWIEIHNQMIVVNPHSWRKLGSPKFGDWETATEELPNYTRSDANFHDKYTPYWVQGADGTSTLTRSRAGWGWLKAAFAQKIKIDNFSHLMRDCRLFVYPISDSELFYNALIANDESMVSNPNQQKFIKQWLNPKEQIWIFNSEAYTFNIPLPQCDTYFGPSAGFKYLDMLHYSPNVKFIFYDYNQSSVNWIKLLKEKWDGNNLKAFLLSQPLELQKLFKFINKNIDINISMLYTEFGGEDNFKQLWNKFKRADAEFIVCDLFDTEQFKNLLSLSIGDKPFVYYSNIFSTDFTSMNFSVSEVDEEYSKFLNTIKTMYPKSCTFGCDTLSSWVHTLGEE
jgi:hypothetical protein